MIVKIEGVSRTLHDGDHVLIHGHDFTFIRGAGFCCTAHGRMPSCEGADAIGGVFFTPPTTRITFSAWLCQHHFQEFCDSGEYRTQEDMEVAGWIDKLVGCDK